MHVHRFLHKQGTTSMITHVHEYAPVYSRLGVTTMPMPHLDPDQRDSADVIPTERYQPADPVWVYRGGVWRAGVIEATSPLAATVTYRPSTTRGTGVDTLTARYLAPRYEADPLLDDWDGALAVKRA